MISTPKSRFLLSILSALLISCESPTTSEASIEKHISGMIVTEGFDTIASFGESESDLKDYLDSNVEFPTEAKVNRLVNRVRMMFIVQEDGSITAIEAKDKSDKALIAEAERVIQEMPNWNPAQKNGHAVATWNTVTVLFTRTKKHIASNGKPGEREVEEFSPSWMRKGYRSPSERTKSRVNKPVLHKDGYFEDRYGRIYISPEFSASYPGGVERLTYFFQSKIRYPELAKRLNKEGIVQVAILLDAEGSLEDCGIIESLGFGLDEEAMHVIRGMPNWTPAMHEGEYVRSMLMVPVAFSLE